ncbi:non-ribosomal peptide synthetase [Paenibacillus polymyxa]|uniref:non-ribosomal peptide synthetase n=1 Tax=Paenibacillus polymyxa TaxID=1406 RepID=UPI0010BEC5FD|nr:non-ribosomal peptide synthetase [Paenibacillus polymyxa]TKH36518.1 non-ribosomal peptide synthetase [Paenibacillus polymyxa]
MSDLKKQNIKDMYRLTPMQQGILYHYMMDKNSDAYFEQISLSIKGILDIDCVEKSVNIIIEKYDALRTIFLYENVAKPLQVVMKERKLSVSYEDITSLAEELRDRYIEEYRVKDRKKGFDLSRDILTRLSVIKTGYQSYNMVWSFHHIIIDGWSLANIFREFMENYEALMNSWEPESGKVYTYSRYIKWLEGRNQNEAADYWETYLKGYEHQTVLPQNGRSASDDFRIEETEFKISEQITSDLEKFAAKNNTTMSTIIKTIWGILLQRYNNTDDVVFGEVVSGRPHEIQGIESMVGLFINTVAVRVSCDEDKTFTELIKEMQQSVLESDRYSFYPLADVQSKTCLKDALIHHVMAFENYPMDEAVNASSSNGILNVVGMEIFEQTNYDFGILVDGGKELSIKFSYNSLVYDGNFIEKIKGHFQSVIEIVTDNPDMHIRNIDILTEVEKKEIVHCFNNTTEEYHREKTIHQLFEEQAVKTPDNAAVVFEGKQLTYRELNEKSNQLARVLRDKGVKPDSIVGIMVERSLEMVIGIFGILKAGGAYMPIDPDYPKARIEYLLEDSEIGVLISKKQFLEKVEFYGKYIDIEDESLYAGNPMNLEVVCSPQNLAYIIYTSGSTGKPKGVMVEHKGVANLEAFFKTRLNVSESDRIIQFASISFDAAVWEIFMGLLAGATLYISSGDIINDYRRFEEYLNENEITIATLPPPYLANLDPEKVTSLKKVIAAGSASTPELLKKWSNRISYINAYGPTETTVCATVWKADDCETADKSVPIGKPITNTRVFIVDENNNLKPIGVEGELCVSGAGLARGYLKKPELTREKFVPNPFMPGELMYKTGDLAKWLPDGNIAFAGRKDHQVKIRGYRIELEEIEAALLKHADINEAVVIDREDSSVGRYLCAYIVSDREVTVTEIRELISKELPDYMIPSYFMRIAKVPLTINGKLDRKALPLPDGRINTGTEYAAPSGEVEERLALLWQDILGIEKVGRNDNFFMLGGHSLKATSLVARIHKEFNVDIPLKEIFKTPTILEIASYIEDSKESLYQSIQRAGDMEYYPMSSAQKRLYILNQLEGAGIAYNIPGIILLEGTVDKARFEQAFHSLIERHESFRTSFHMIEEELSQKVHDKADLSIMYLETSEEKVPEIVEKFIRPFDLGKAPLLRVGLVKIGEARHIMVFDMHHIISDGVSNDILVREFISLYEGKILPPLRIQYKDYSVWQRELFAGAAISKQEEFWLQTFQGEIPVLDLSTDYPRPAVQSFEGDYISFEADSELAVRLNKLGSDNGATLYMTLLAAYNVLLSRYTGQEDIIVGSPIAGRPHADLQDIIGMFVNTLAMRNHPQGEKTFIVFLKEVKENALKAYDNQDYQFEELVDKLDIRRDMSRNPLFDTMFAIYNVGKAELITSDLSFKPYNKGIEGRISKFDITLNAFETEDGIAFELEYCTRLFKKETVERLGAHYINLLEEIAAYPEKRLYEIEMLSQEEKQQVLYSFNDTALEYPLDKTIHQMFEEQVKKTPDHIAVVFEGKQLTYRELNQKANQLARALREKGVKPDDIVGIMVDRSPEMVIGIMSVIKAGGAYLPVDPNYPLERKRYMMEDSKAKILLTQNHLMDRDDFDGEIIDLSDYDYNFINDVNIKCINKPGDTAYIIYTSGSTGNPKGVCIDNKSVLNLVEGLFQRIYSKYESPLNVCLIAPYVFDASVQQIFAALLMGHALYIVPEEARKDGKKLLDFYSENRIDISDGTPIHVNMMLNSPPIDNNLKVRHFIIGGDVLPFDAVKDFLSRFEDVQPCITNVYGPTECCVDSTEYLITAAGLSRLDNIPIGRPLPNTRAYILGKKLEVNPIGIAGELYISGDGLAKGYLNKTGLTAERFVSNPFIKGERMYRTGDLARWLPDGNIEFLGRMDHQVKIRGFRIELGEIEAQLLRHASIKEAVVIVKEDQQKNKDLCAYFVGENELTITELRECLSKELPEYMIPAYFMQLDEMPLTANGKIDRKNLPHPAAHLNTGVEYEAPSGEVEEKLVQLWQDILGVEKIGRNDNFFVLGGHSLKAINFAAKIHKEFNVNISLKEIFKLPTIAEIAKYIQEAQESIYQSIQPTGEMEYYPMSSSQRRLYILNQLEGARVAYNMPEFMLLEGSIDIERFEKALDQLVKRHEAFRTSFHMVDGEPVQKVHDEVEFSIMYMETGEEKASEAANEFIRPFDLGKAPLLRAGLVKIREDRHVMMLDKHHIISDGVSDEILVREFISLYEGMNLPALQIQYKDYSVWQNKLFADGTISKQEEYWLQAFRGEIPVLDMPVDYPRPAIQSFEGDMVSFETGRELAHKLNKLAVDHGATLYMVLLASYNVLLFKYTGQEDVVIGSPIAGRPHTDLQDIIGMFVNTLAMRNYPQGKKNFSEFLMVVKENALRAYENQDYPFEELVEKLSIKRDLSRNPLFDTMFVLQNKEASEFKMNGLRFMPYDNEFRASKFDLTLNAQETQNNIVFGLKYATRLFKKETIEKLGVHFINVLEEITAYPEKMLSEINILSQDEKQQILNSFNDTKAEYPRDKTLHELFQDQVERTPDNVAVVFEDKQLTYRQLNEKANQLARALRSNGVKQNSIVGIMVERSVDMQVGILGILKAGGVYLPISTKLPELRIKKLLEDSNATMLLTQSHLADKAEFYGNILLLDSPEMYIGSAENLDKINKPEDLAYIIYTSGSTGVPKGSMIEHRSVVNLVYGLRKLVYENYDNYLNVALVSPYFFDASVKQIFAASLLGHTLFIVPEDTRLDGEGLLKYYNRNSIAVSDGTPAHIKLLTDTARPGESLSVMQFIIGGEELSCKGIQGFYDRFKDNNPTITNVYGPTECCVDSTYYHLSREKVRNLTSIPIGMPLQNYKIYILNEDMNILPVNTTGEIYISGDGLAKGYLNKLELTTEKFVANPFSSGERMYRTGDLGRWLPDGNIEFIGRVDHQVKIRGFRIELGEIEVQLLKHPSIKEAAVIAKTDQEGNKYLCAYIAGESEFTISDLRALLLKELPDYMIPQYFVQLEKLPLTANGKIDRNNLPQNDGTLATSVEYVEPCGEVEEKLALLWHDALGVQKIGVNDNFFELGGYSLKAISLISRIYEQLNVEVPLKDFYMAPTIKEIARFIHNTYANDYITPSPAIHFNSAMESLMFAFPPGGGNGIAYGSLSKQMNAYSIYSFDFIENESRMEEYVKAITSVKPEGPYILFGYSAGGNLAFEVAKVLIETGHHVSDIIFLDSAKSFVLIEEESEDAKKLAEQQDKEFIEENEKLIKGMFGDNQAVIEKAIERMRNYHKYTRSVINSGQINSNIHLIISQQQDNEGEADLSEGWREATTGEFKVYNGFGSHFDMLSTGYIDKNAAIIKEILEEINQ